MTETYDVVVIGGGVEGLSVGWTLAGRGVRAAVVERASLCSGATGKGSGVVRCHYGVPSLAAMARYGRDFLEDATTILGADAGFHRTGYIIALSATDSDELEANVSLQRQIGIQTELIDRAEVERLWPSVDLEGCGAFAYEPLAGYASPRMAGLAFAGAARRMGVDVKEGTPVVEIATDSSGRAVGVRTAGGDVIGAGAVVVAAGPWSVGLCEPLGVRLPIRSQREQIVLISTADEFPERPVFADLVIHQYVRSDPSGRLLLGSNDNSAPEYIDPDLTSGPADEDYVSAALARFARRFPRVSVAEASSTYVGFYDVTPDYNAIIGPTPVNGLYVCAGFSGHGFKLSPAVGRLVADLILTGESSDPLVNAKDFRIERFAEGDLLVSEHQYTGAGQMR